MTKSDWKKLTTSVPLWRERYLQTKNQEILAILNNQKLNPTEIFWKVEAFSQKLQNSLKHNMQTCR